MGRITFNRSLPDDHPFINHSIDKKGIGRIVEECSVRYSATQMGQILDEIKRLGFHYATRAGVTFDVVVLPHPSGRSTWLNKPQHQRLFERERAQDADGLRHGQPRLANTSHSTPRTVSESLPSRRSMMIDALGTWNG